MREKYFTMYMVIENYSGYGYMIIHDGDVVEGSIAGEDYFVGMLVDKTLVIRFYKVSGKSYRMLSEKMQVNISKLKNEDLPIDIDFEVDANKAGFIRIESKFYKKQLVEIAVNKIKESKIF